MTSNAAGTTESLPAVIWVADDPEWEKYTGQCVEWCCRNDYKIVAVVEERTGGRYEDAQQLITDGRAALVVVAGRDQLPPDRIPRLEVVAEERRRLIPKQRGPSRPRFLRR